MKKLLFLAVAFVAGLSAMAQQKADEVLKVNTEKYDFGKIKQGVPVTTYFTLTNTSDKPVVIENAWGSCGCTTPEFSKEPIPAGGTSKLKVGYNAAAMGHFEKQVTIKLAGIPEAKVVNITGEVVGADAQVDATSKTNVQANTPAAKVDAKSVTTVSAPVTETKSVTKTATTKTKTKTKKTS